MSKPFILEKQIVQVEISPYQVIPKPLQENNSKMGTIEDDEDYINFVKSLEESKKQSLPSAEERLNQSEVTDKSAQAHKLSLQSNLVQYMIKKQTREKQPRKTKGQHKNSRTKVKGILGAHSGKNKKNNTNKKKKQQNNNNNNKKKNHTKRNKTKKKKNMTENGEQPKKLKLRKKKIKVGDGDGGNTNRTK